MSLIIICISVYKKLISTLILNRNRECPNFFIIASVLFCLIYFLSDSFIITIKNIYLINIISCSYFNRNLSVNTNLILRNVDILNFQLIVIIVIVIISFIIFVNINSDILIFTRISSSVSGVNSKFPVSGFSHFNSALKHFIIT